MTNLVKSTRPYLVAAVGLVLAACAHDTSESSESTQTVVSALTGANCTVAGACQLTMPIVPQVDPTTLTVVALNDVQVGDRARLVDASGNFKVALVNAGTGSTTLGANARVGSVFSYGPVTLRSNSRVDGTVQSAKAVLKQDGATVAGQITQNGNLGTAGKVSWPVLYPAVAGAAINLEPSQTRTVSPGRYTSLTVKSGATVTLQSGAYYFDSIDLEPQGKIISQNTAGSVFLYATSNVIFRGSIQEQGGAAADLLLGYLGTGQVDIGSPFRGTVVAPNGSIRLAPGTTMHHLGAFIGKSVDIEPDVLVTFTPLSHKGPALAGVVPQFTQPSGAPPPAPPPTNLGNDIFEWGQIFGAYATVLTTARYVGPTINLPTPFWGKRNPDGTFTVPAGLQNGSPIRALNARQPGDPPPCEIRPGTPPSPPLDNPLAPFHFGSPPNSDAPIDAFFTGFGNFDLGQLPLFGNFAHEDAAMSVGLSIFGHTLDAGVCNRIDTASDLVQSSGPPIGSAYALFEAKLLGAIIADKEFNVGQHIDPVPIATFDKTVLDFPIPIPPIGNLELQAGLHADTLVQADLSPTKLTATITPEAAATMTLLGGVGFSAGIGVKLDVVGTVDLLKLSLPINANAAWDFDRSPEVCAASLTPSLNYAVKGTTLSGGIKVCLLVSIGIGPFSIADFPILCSPELFSYPGFSIGDGSVHSILNGPTLSFNLRDINPDACQFGEASCTTTPADVTWSSPPGAWVTNESVQGAPPVGSTYGHDTCKEQYIAEIDTSHVTGSELSIIGIWDPNIVDPTPCEDRLSNVAIWGFDGTTWHPMENAKLEGKTQAGTCLVVVGGRAPNEVSTLPFDTAFHLPNNLGFSKIRVAANATFSGVKQPLLMIVNDVP